MLLAGRSEDKCSRACNSPGKIKSGGLLDIGTSFGRVITGEEKRCLSNRLDKTLVALQLPTKAAE